MCSNLLLKDILFCSAYEYYDVRSVCSCSALDWDKISFNIIVSSTKEATVECETVLLISAMWTRKKMGPRNDSCGTPLSTTEDWDTALFTATRCYLPVRKECSHIPIFPVMLISLILCSEYRGLPYRMPLQNQGKPHHYLRSFIPSLSFIFSFCLSLSVRSLGIWQISNL